MTNIDDLLNPNYILSDEDVLRARFQTVGVHRHSIGIKDFEYKFLDVGGERSERCKWHHHYSHVNHIIFVISLPGYYQCLVEDNEVVSLFRGKLIGQRTTKVFGSPDTDERSSEDIQGSDKN